MARPVIVTDEAWRVRFSTIDLVILNQMWNIDTTNYIPIGEAVRRPKISGCTTKTTHCPEKAGRTRASNYNRTCLGIG
ncbi:MAG: hypothetical protein R2788_12555 [Saprospiraceae bacterium]